MYSEPGQHTNGPMTQKAVTDELYNATSLDVSYGGDYSWILGAISADTGKAISSSSYNHINIPVSGGMLVGIKANAERLTQYAFLKDNNFSYTSSPGTDISSHYCDGYNNVIAIDAGKSATFTIPEDCNYLYVLCGQTSGYVHAPESVVVFSSLKEDFLELSDELEQLQEKVDGIILKTINTSSLQSVKAFMTPTNGGTWYTSASTNKGKFIPVTAGEKYIITAAEQYSYFAFLTSNVYGSNNTPVTTFATDEYCHFERSGSVTNITAPSDAEYLFISVLNGTVDCTPIVQLQRDVSQELDNMQEKQDMLLSDVGEITYDLNVFPLQACLNAITYWAGSTNRSIFIPIRGSQVFRITANDSYPSIVSFHTSNVWSTANSTRTINNYAHGEYTRHDLAKGCTHILISPSDAKYMCVYIKSDDSNIYTPDEIVKLDVSNTSVITQKLEASKLASINACRNAHVVSQSKYIYTFAIDSLILKDNEFIVNYNASETDTDADTIAEVVNADHCLDKVSILNFSTVNGSEPSYTIEKTDSTVIQGFVGWTARVLVNNNICVLGVCRQTNKNPFYVYAILEGDEESFVYKECKLKYTPTGGSQTTVDFTVNNYRQMLVDCGFASSYLASQGEAADNCNLCYENGIYYIFTATSPSSALPLMCLKSTDLETWEVVGVVLSNNMRINEVSAVVKNGIGYIMYRTTTDWSRACFAIYDIANNTLINSGVFHDAVESRADVFTFEGDVYLAYNVLPSTYKSTTSLVRPDQGGRNEINVYKVVDNNPIFFRRICNPTGLNYFRFQETPVYVDSMNTWWNQGAIYLAYSEDRRHLYRRQFANISIADVTAVFADFGRVF